MSRITILTIGSRGDVEPLIALAKGLVRSGHKVRLATHEIFRHFVESNQLEFFALEGDPQKFFRMREGEELLDSGQSTKMMTRISTALNPLIEKMAIQSKAACQDTDIILSTLQVPVGWHTAQALKLPCILIGFVPLSHTHAFPMPFLRNKSLGRTLNWASYTFFQQIAWATMRSAVNKARIEILDLPPCPIWGFYKQVEKQQVPIYYACSPSVAPNAPDWPSWVQYTGYWFSNDNNDWTASTALDNFLNAGSPPIYFGLGSMSGKKAEAVFRNTLEAINRSGVRAIVAGGWNNETSFIQSENLFYLREAPHSWLLPRVSLAIHHGGAGTTAAALRAGIPSIFLPFFGDQPWWANRVSELGAGLSPVKTDRLDIEVLANSIQISLKDCGLRERAQIISSKIKEDDGVNHTVHLFDDWFKSL
jgi:sterol 3beta-glucosyltransferase